MNEYELADAIRTSDKWNPELCKRLCELAGLEDEWDSADAESFESAVCKAAEFLGVEI